MDSNPTQVTPQKNAAILTMPSTTLPLVILTICLGLAGQQVVRGETIPLSSILPKIEAIHEDAKSLLIKNVELKNQILAGYQAQNEAKIASVKEGKSIMSGNKPQDAEGAPHNARQQLVVNFSAPQSSHPVSTNSSQFSIDYSELEEFNKWVEVNLEYAVKNTQATVEALKDEAQLNNGNVEYTEQAIKDGIEGVKYWQAAVIFQDKTLKREKFEPQLD